MSVTEPSPLEMRVSAYVDGEVSDTERQDLENLLANDSQMRELHEELKSGRQAGRIFFDQLLKEPVPLNLVRGIKNAPLPRKAVSLPDSPRAASFRPSGLQALGACLITLIVGGSLGYMVGTHSANVQSPQILAGTVASPRDWLDDIVSHYRLYSRQQNRLVEVSGDQTAAIQEWLTTGTGVSFRIPDLNESGLTFVGARLIATDNTPTGLLFYRRSAGDNDGDILAITLSRARPETTKSVEDIRLDTALVTWSTPLATYVIVGPSSAADLDDIAAKAAGLI